MTDRPEDDTSAALAAPRRRMFGSRVKHLSADAVERQSRVTLLAWDLLGADTARAFLNAYHDALEGRPLDLAVASTDGCEAVELAIAAHAAGARTHNLPQE